MTARLALVAAIGLLVAAVAGAAATDRTPEAVARPAGFGAGPVHEAEARTPGWDAIRDDDCVEGDPACMAVIVEEMAARLEAQGCAHTAPFAFTYLEMTRGVQAAVEEPGFFADPANTTHADARFARYYFQAVDNWAAGRIDDVPGVWRLAFGAAEAGETSAATDLLLGMTAHISRDLPYVVAEVAGWQQGGEGGEDFERVNEVIASVKGPMLAAAAQRFDPTLALLDLPLPALAGDDSVDIIGRWRDQALERGLRLVQARTDAEREVVEAEIEREAMATAVLILNAGTSQAGALPPAARDAYCEERR